MSVDIGALFHWSPSKNRASILKHGLQVMQPCSDQTDAAFPWICLGTTPSSAWGLIPDKLQSERWDLWQVRLREGDRVTYRSLDTPHIREVRVQHGLPSDRVWFVGERHEAGPHCT
jgi:hypothetical protein